jgi:endonuclease YncB( thermonuclease family)
MRLFRVVSVVVSVASALVINPVSFSSASAASPDAVPQRLVGTARALDGDTLDVTSDRGVVRVRLQGIDAAEGGQRCNMRWIGTWDCGRAATIGLAQLVAQQTVTCETDGLDKYSRILAVCFAGQRNINADLVREGLAWAFVQYSTLYVAEEAEARRARRGIWQADTMAPWTWRAEQRQRQQESVGTAQAPLGLSAPQQRTEPLSQSAGAAAPRGCDIKGNVTKSGERIYHTASSPWYERIRMSIGGGRRWFCSEAEARDAGWRPAGMTTSAN